jgi:sugar lactone lactonase YvrE
MRLVGRTLIVLVVVVGALLVGIRAEFGGGRRLEDRTTAPALPASAIELVTDLDYPPGNIAVAPSGRVFFTLHPDGKPPVGVMELVDGKPAPYRHREAPAFQTVLSLRIDRQNRLWLLDYADYGRGQPRLLAFDLATDRLVHQYDFPPDVAGFLSMLNDFQIDPAGEKIYIAESSPIIQRPAVIVYDTVKRTSRRLLERHPSVMPQDYVLQLPGRDMTIFGIYTLRIGIDSIALDKRGEWLYYGPVNGDRLYRVATRDLDDESLTPAALAAKVEDFGPKTLSDGLTMDVADHVYLTDPEHSAIVTLGPERTLRTLVKDARLRWPDGMSFGPDGWLYLTCSALHHVLFVSSAHVRANAPYQIFRFQPGTPGVPGQ